MPTTTKPRIQCATYTRKSSEEGLEQAFNSLEAQREACEAYISSQRHEGWRLISTAYDDGGYSGGTMDRPALKRLLQDAENRKIDVVVVYKVDRLTRALADFAKIIEIFDAHHVSFVSVTQQFNTTTSMGRLTLNVLLSFAQFEREVTGERIRDKIAASKRKGLWMGGNVPLGYDARDRKLVVNAEEAEAVRKIYRQYLKLGCVSKLKTYLERHGLRSKERLRRGHKTGGIAYSRGALYNLLQNRIYRGEIEHKGQVYPGEHEPIVPRELWQRVQARLRANDKAHQNRSRAALPSLLTGLLYDEHGNRFTPTHAVKNGKRYRYYVSQAAIRHPGRPHRGPVRIPAGEIEGWVGSRLRAFLASPHEVIDRLSLKREDLSRTHAVLATARQWSVQLGSAAPAATRSLIRKLISRIVISSGTLDLVLDKQALRDALLGNSRCPVPLKARGGHGHLTFRIKVRLQRCGGQVRLVLPPNSDAESPVHPSASLVKAVVRAHDWYQRMVRGQLRGTRSIAEATGLEERYVSRILRCAFLAPDIVAAILEGRQPPSLTLHHLVSDLPSDWGLQRQRLGFAAR